MGFQIMYRKLKSIKNWPRNRAKHFRALLNFVNYWANVAVSTDWRLPMKPRTMQPTFARPPWPNTSFERLMYKRDIGLMPNVCYVLKGFSAGFYSFWEIQITSFRLFGFCRLLSSWHFTLESSPDQRPHHREICIKGRFWGIVWPSK